MVPLSEVPWIRDAVGREGAGQIEVFDVDRDVGHARVSFGAVSSKYGSDQVAAGKSMVGVHSSCAPPAPMPPSMVMSLAVTAVAVTKISMPR